MLQAEVLAGSALMDVQATLQGYHGTVCSARLGALLLSKCLQGKHHSKRFWLAIGIAFMDEADAIACECVLCFIPDLGRDMRGCGQFGNLVCPYTD